MGETANITATGLELEFGALTTATQPQPLPGTKALLQAASTKATQDHFLLETLLHLGLIAVCDLGSQFLSISE